MLPIRSKIAFTGAQRKDVRSKAFVAGLATFHAVSGWRLGVRRREGLLLTASEACSGAKVWLEA